jgi:Family of unknown function (DUF5947)
MFDVMPQQIAISGATVRGLATLRAFAGRAVIKASTEHCELCSALLAVEHQHLIDPRSRKIACSCDACAMLFDGAAGQYRRVPRDTRWLADFRLTDADWDDLLIPINMAFLFHSSVAARVLAIYPSPAGPMESLLTLEAWQQIEEHNPALRSMRPDVETLLINRLGPHRGFANHQYFLAPIDECYKLVGLVRGHWRGLAGGETVWREISAYFSRLTERSARVTRIE